MQIEQDGKADLPHYSQGGQATDEAGRQGTGLGCAPD